MPCAVVLLLLVGCSSPPPRWAEPRCPLVGAQDLTFGGTKKDHGGGIPDDFVASWVLRCRIETREVTGEGKLTVQIAERADTSVSDLVDRLRLPSEQRWWFEDGGCAAVVVPLPYFVLVDSAGKAVQPSVPVTTCHFPRKEVRDALDALPFRTLSETTLRERESYQAPGTGCDETSPDLLASDAHGFEPGPAVPLPGDSVRVCIYHTENSKHPRQFDAGYTTTGDAATALLDALGGTGPAEPCTTPHTRFAVLEINGPAGRAVAEIDGCHRLLRPDNTLGQLDASTLVALRP